MSASGECSNLLCDREKPCTACKTFGRERLASAMAAVLARKGEVDSFDRSIRHLNLAFQSDDLRFPSYDEGESANAMFGRRNIRNGVKRRERGKTMQDRAYRMSLAND